jgi:hypothetical protein
MHTTTAYSAIIALTLALTAFTGLTTTAPRGYPADSIWDHGLIREIAFDSGTYRSPCDVSGRLLLVNPSKADVTFNLTHPVTCDYYKGSMKTGTQGTGAPGESFTITVPAGGEYTVMVIGFNAPSKGWYEVDWGGLRRGIDVGAGDLIPRMVTDKQVYRLGEGGTALFEFYNPRSVPVSFSPPSSVDFREGINGVLSESGSGIYLEWISANFTVAPGGSFEIFKFGFSTYEVGSLTLYGMGLSRTVQVIP